MEAPVSLGESGDAAPKDRSHLRCSVIANVHWDKGRLVEIDHKAGCLGKGIKDAFQSHHGCDVTSSQDQCVVSILKNRAW